MTGAMLLLLMMQTAVQPGREAPPLTWTVPEHGATTLEQLRDHPVVLEFGYSTCKPCQAVAERLNRVAEEFRARGVLAFEILFDPNSPQLVPVLAKDQKLTVPVAWTTGESAMRFLGYTHTDRPEVPQIVVLDGTGRIRYQTSAQGSDALRTEAGIRAKLSELLAPAAASLAQKSSRANKR